MSILISDNCVDIKNKRDPGRRFYLCGAFFSTGHVLKWVDETHTEKFGALAKKQSMMAMFVSLWDSSSSIN